MASKKLLSISKKLIDFIENDRVINFRKSCIFYEKFYTWQIVQTLLSNI